ncbi:MAG TPA: hypothetical protein VGX28_05445 [Frankiaceae bacterium]|jgi:hypothetical protein|nr:hypothetical protein [Frankiaceae bacterium]
MSKYEDPDWPSSATAEGQSLRFYAALSEPGNPRRAKRMLLWLAGFVAAVAIVVVLVALLS